ncbi:MAG: hypothetical protein H8E55_21260 [Pelagibacterales bacterium]|nr:hypothetical protein [Pelagibacterales bacterium]
MKVNVIAKLEIEGMHNWPDAKAIFPEVAFLSDMHRHKWFITVKCPVNHNDRDKEFFILKRDILDYMRDKYYNSSTRTHEFGAKSCEMLAQEIQKEFDAVYVSVFEDNECGAEVYL